MICRNVKISENLIPGASNKIIKIIERSETMRGEVDLVTWQSGQNGSIEKHEDKEQLLFILEGTGIIQSGHITSDVKPGDFFFVPANMSYHIIAKGNSPFGYLLFNAFLAGEITSERKPIFIDNVKSRKVYDFGSNSTILILDRAEAEQCEATIVSWPPHHRGAVVAHNDKEQTFYVISGSGTVMVDKETLPVKVGDVIFVPYNTPHTTEAGEETLTYFCFNAIATQKKYSSFDEMYHIVIGDRLRRWKEKDETVGL